MRSDSDGTIVVIGMPTITAIIVPYSYRGRRLSQFQKTKMLSERVRHDCTQWSKCIGCSNKGVGCNLGMWVLYCDCIKFGVEILRRSLLQRRYVMRIGYNLAAVKGAEVLAGAQRYSAKLQMKSGILEYVLAHIIDR